MKFIASILVAAGLATASVIPRDGAGLDIQLTAEGNTMIKAVITNKNSVDVSILNKGTILDPDAVEKVVVANADGAVPFTGMRKRVGTTGLDADAFTPLAAGASIEVMVDIAAVHDLSAGGALKVSTYGAIPYAEGNSTELLVGKALTYLSNELDINVDGAEAAKVKRAYPDMGLEKRTQLQSNTCSSTRLTALRNALTNCRQLASAAATAAQSGSATKFQEYFKTTSSSTRGNVAARLRAVASECGSTTSGATTYYCTDVYNACTSGVLAYTLPSQDLVVSCPIFFNNLPALSRTCHAQDQATTVLHEFTHAPGVYSPGTEDNGYGYAAATALSASQALANADSYALYANAIYVGC